MVKVQKNGEVSTSTHAVSDILGGEIENGFG